MVGNLFARELVRLVALLPECRADVVISLNGINEFSFADRDWYRDPDSPRPHRPLYPRAPAGDGGEHVPRRTLRGARGDVDAGRPDAVLHSLLAKKGHLESVSYLCALLRDRGRSFDWFHDASLPDVVPDSDEYYHSPRYPNAKGNARIADAILKVL